MLVVGEHNGLGSANHRGTNFKNQFFLKGYIGLLDVSTGKVTQWANIKPDLGSGSEFWASPIHLVNLPNSKYISA